MNRGIVERAAAAGLAVTAVSECAYAATEAEKLLVGKAPDEALYRAAGQAAAAQAQPASDSHGPAEYKRSMTVEMTARALRAAVERAAARR